VREFLPFSLLLVPVFVIWWAHWVQGHDRRRLVAEIRARSVRRQLPGVLPLLDKREAHESDRTMV